ncbi:MAG TPA: TetR/AcrR family transcriptional regulator [Chryseolinea sp.]|jgi:TetR/AcrR family transcriptional regulator, fatty acid metabolism regulator protein|nr:TetR/AcrR family transcriptional regulator [Chryseolinea sp.]HPM32411.1 TetR/AcrR family transcriptional regulator [Chryseolinea sp.]
MEIKERQLEIIEAAGEILTESGIAGLTTKNLAAKMGFAESALYRHFKGKEEIILTMLRYLAKDMDNRLTTSASDIDSPKEKLIAVFNNQFEFFKKNPHFLVAIFSDGLLEESKAINEAILQIMGTKRKHLLQIIQQGQKQKQFTDTLSADELVHIIMGSFRLHMLQWRLSDFSFDLKSKGNKLVANLLTLIQPNTSLL